MYIWVVPWENLPYGNIVYYKISAECGVWQLRLSQIVKLCLIHWKIIHFTPDLNFLKIAVFADVKTLQANNKPIEKCHKGGFLVGMLI